MAIFPDGYTDKSTLVAWDKVFWYDSESSTPTVDWNKNFTILAIYNYVIATVTTSNVTEWANLYYTEARVNANTTVSTLVTNVETRALKTNVLEKNNTTAYTPTADYHPVTKKYLDDKPITQSTTTQLWGNTIATDTEAKAWIDEVKTINSKELVETTNLVYLASNNIKLSALTERTWDDDVNLLVKSFKLWHRYKYWTLRITYDWWKSASWSFNNYEVFVNWSLKYASTEWALEEWTNGITWDFNADQNDLLEFKVRRWTIRNVTISYDIMVWELNDTVTLD